MLSNSTSLQGLVSDVNKNSMDIQSINTDIQSINYEISDIASRINKIVRYIELRILINHLFEFS